MDRDSVNIPVYCLDKWLLEAGELSPIEKCFSQHNLAEINCLLLQVDDYHCKIQAGCTLNNPVYRPPFGSTVFFCAWLSFNRKERAHNTLRRGIVNQFQVIILMSGHIPPSTP